jgi:hypothetical protein
MLERILGWRHTKGTYEGVRAGLIPLDATLSLLAKRSYPLYRVWNAYNELTNPLFDAGAPAAGPADPRHLDELRTHGYAIVENAFPAAQVADARAFLLDRYRRAKEDVARRDPSGTQPILEWNEDRLGYEYFRRTGRVRIQLTGAVASGARLPSLLTAFADVAAHKDLSADYLGTRAILSNQPYYAAEILEPAAGIEPWHIDCLRPTIKSFLLLSDVGAAQGPLRYVPGTHRVDETRLKMFYRISEGGLGHAYFDDRTNAELDTRGVSLTAPANTLILFDNRGLHASSFCTEGLRVVLVNGYRPRTATRLNPRLFRDPRPVPYPWEQRAPERP